MELLNKVKDELEKKGYDFSSEFWTDEELTVLYDAVYTTEKVLSGQERAENPEPKPETPEPTLTVPENVEFVLWGECFALVYNGLVLSITREEGFALRDKLDWLDRSRLKNLKLIPCKLEEVKNGEWVVYKFCIDDSAVYRLKTEKGWVSFDGSDEYPIEIETELSDSGYWLKVVRE